MKNDIAAATVSWIRTKSESSVVLGALGHLSRLNIPVVVVDAGSPLTFQQQIKSLPHVVFFENRGGLTKQLLQSHREAAKLGDALLYLQSDKPDFARDTAPKMIDIYRKLTKKGVLVPTRTRESLDTYPPYQREQEAFINSFVGQYIGIREDYYAGPKIYPSFFAGYLGALQGDIGWGIEAYCYVIAKRLGLPFDFLPCFISAPVDIDDEETTREYRLRITKWQIEGFLQALELPLHEKNSK